jgi:hypothetical protein
MRRTEKRRGPVWAAPGRFFDLFNDVVVRDGETRGLFLAGPGKEVNSVAPSSRHRAGGRHVAHLA